MDTLPSFITGTLLDHFPVDFEPYASHLGVHLVNNMVQVADDVIDVSAIPVFGRVKLLPVLLHLAFSSHLLH
jgi:hypothetical protein